LRSLASALEEDSLTGLLDGLSKIMQNSQISSYTFALKLILK